MPANKPPNREQVIAQVIGELEGPTPLETIVDRVLERKPSNAKNARSAVRSDIRLRADFLGIVFGDSERKIIVPASVAMRGVRFRHIVTAREVSGRELRWSESDTAYLAGKYWPLHFSRTDLQLVDANGSAIPGRPVMHVETAETFLGLQQIQVAGHKLPAFMHQHRVAAGDSLLLTVEQYDPPRWRIEHEPRAQRDEAAIGRRNRALVDLLYAMLEMAPQERIDTIVSVRSALFQMREPHGYPGDPWVEVVEADGRMGISFMGIVYADSPRYGLFGFESDDESFADYEILDDDGEQLLLIQAAEDGAIVELEVPPRPPLPPLPEADAQRIYTLKVVALYRKGLWRRIELLGGLLLGDLNRYLVGVFKHDWDHMGGFWRVVRRGRQRTREVELAMVDPFGRGKGSELRIAELNLAEGDVLKWVYDFGDNFEYTLQLETTVDPPSAPDPNEFPRVAGANEPKLLYCTSCQTKGKQVVAQWVCWDCSERQNAPYMLCDACARLPKHEEHYLEEWVY
jgi:hypothetical protein